MAAARLMVVAQDESLLSHVTKVIRSKDDCDFESVSDLQAAKEAVSTLSVALLIIHVPTLSEVDQAVDFISTIVTKSHPIPCITIIDQDDPDATYHLVRAGAIECLVRPLNTSRLSLLIDLLTATVRLRPRAKASATISSQKLTEYDLGDEKYIISSESMRGLSEQLRSVAPLDTTILITGETGTGKSRLARLIHRLSTRRSKRFVPVNCGALPPTLIESELFGHAKGAFTSADKQTVGKFGEARDGTLLLDDVNCIPIEVQGALLRAVEDRVYEPVGGTKTQHVDARLIVTSNLDVRREVDAGRFRADLFYRLSVISFHLPPLRERRSEIPFLADRFIEWSCKHHHLSCPGLTEEAVEMLMAYSWPGNIRELHNIMERSVIMCRNKLIDAHHLPRNLLESTTPGPTPSLVKKRRCRCRNPLARARWEAERNALMSALERNSDNRTETAHALGISRAALYKKLQKYGLTNSN